MAKPNTLDLVSNLNLESERKYAATSNRAARVKIDKGHAWLVRFLPFPQGPGRQPFIRIAQHWIGGRPFSCKRHTCTDLGGSPDASCPPCDVSEQMHSEASDDRDRDDFYQVQAREHYRGYCLVFSKENDRGDRTDMSPEEMLIAHEFLIPKTSFAVLAAKIDRSKGGRSGSPLGLLDLENGTDLWAARDKKNSLTFDLSEQGPGPILTLDDQFEAKIARIWKQLKQPTVNFLTDDRLNAIADMIAEKAFEKAAKSMDNRDDRGGSSRGGSSRGGSSRGRFHEDDDQSAGRGGRDDGAAEEPPRRAASGRGFQRAQAALEPAQEEAAAPAEDDQIPGAEVPAAQEEAAPAEEAPPAPTRTSPRRAPVDTAADVETPSDAAQEEAPAVAPRRATTGAARQPAGGRVAVPPSVAAGRRAGAPLPPPPAAKTGGGRVEESTPAEDPPEEANDQAPPAAAETAPATTRTAPAAAARGALNSNLRASISNLTQRGR